MSLHFLFFCFSCWQIYLIFFGIDNTQNIFLVELSINRYLSFLVVYRFIFFGIEHEQTSLFWFTAALQNTFFRNIFYAVCYVGYTTL